MFLFCFKKNYVERGCDQTIPDISDNQLCILHTIIQPFSQASHFVCLMSYLLEKRLLKTYFYVLFPMNMRQTAKI